MPFGTGLFNMLTYFSLCILDLFFSVHGVILMKKACIWVPSFLFFNRTMSVLSFENGMLGAHGNTKWFIPLTLPPLKKHHKSRTLLKIMDFCLIATWFPLLCLLTINFFSPWTVHTYKFASFSLHYYGSWSLFQWARSVDVNTCSFYRTDYWLGMRSSLVIQITENDFISSQTYERLEEDYRHVGYNQGLIHVALDNSGR